jgi:hypothetical protein
MTDKTTAPRKPSESLDLLTKIDELADYHGKKASGTLKARYVRRLSKCNPRSLSEAIERSYDECERFPTTGALLDIVREIEQSRKKDWSADKDCIGDPNCPICKGTGWKPETTEQGNSAVCRCPCMEAIAQGWPPLPGPKARFEPGEYFRLLKISLEHAQAYLDKHEMVRLSFDKLMKDVAELATKKRMEK